MAADASGSLRRQDINSHDIDYIEYVGPSLTWGSTCVKSVWRNDIKCKYMFMFPQKNLAHKGLKFLSVYGQDSACHFKGNFKGKE